MIFDHRQHKILFTVQIRANARILKQWYGCRVADETKLLDLYDDFASGMLDGGNQISDEFRTAVVECNVGVGTEGKKIAVQCDLTISEVKCLVDL